MRFRFPTRRLFRALISPIFQICLILLLFSANSFADENGGVTLERPLGPGGAGSANASAGTVLPDLFSGTMSYTVPIEATPGRKGMDPTLALTYRSSNGNGLVGMGWELELGAIERQTRNGVNYNGDDYVFRMAGATVDLIRTSGASPGDGEFFTRIEGAFTRFKKIGSYWEATDKTGTSYFFGQTAVSRQDGTPGVFKWCLDRVEDPNDNYMTLTYSKDQGQIYLDRIDYTYPGPTNYVKFYWESRTDAPQMYTTNFSVVTSKRLKAIDVWGNGNHIRAYKLSYTYSSSTGRSLLSAVQQFDKDSSVDTNGVVTGGTALPPITFSALNVPPGFIDDQYSWASGMYGSWDASADRIRSADVDGDGRADILIGPDNSSGNEGKWYVMRSTGTSFDNNNQTWASGLYGDWYDKSNRIRNADVNGDGRSDIILGPDGNGQWHVMLSTGTSFVNAGGPWNPVNSIYAGWINKMDYVRNTDVNGDGKADIVIGPDNTPGNGGKWYVLLSTGSSFDDRGSSWTPTGLSYVGWANAYSRIRNVDLNGDGKSDILIGPDGNGKWYVMLSTGTSFNNKENSWTPNGTPYGIWDGSANRIRNADVNGDGKPDIVIGPNAAGRWYVLLNTGASFQDKGAWTPDTIFGSWSSATDRIRNVDVNGDGRADILIGPNANGEWFVLRSAGTSFDYNNGVPWITGAYGIWDGAASRIRNADVDGEGKTDIVIGPDANGKWYVMRPNPGIPDLLTSISNGLGGTTTVTYEPSIWDTNPQPPGGGGSGPPLPPPPPPDTNDTQLPFPVQTVSEVTVDDGNGHPVTTQYEYSGGFYHTAEHDFRGFNNVKVTGPTGAITETWFHQGNDIAVDVNDPWASVGYMKGKPYRVKVSNSSSNVYSETTTSYAQDTTAPYFNPPMEVVSCTDDSGPCTNGKQTKVRYADATGAPYYDSYGNLTREDQYGDTGTSSDDRTIIRSFYPNATSWIAGLPATETIYSGIGTGGSKVSEGRFYYDNAANYNTAPAKGNLTKAERWLDTAGTYLTTTMTYDTYGNLLTTTDARGNTTSICYDAGATFPQSVTNPLGHVTKTEYYGVNWNTACGAAPAGYGGTGLYGQAKSMTDPNGSQTKTSYDTFGRKSLVTYPDGTWTSLSYNNYGAVGAQHIRTDTAAGLTGWTYFDGLSRTIKEKKSGPDSKVIVVETKYNSQGLVYQTSLPYFEGIEAARYTTFTYDPLGRLTQTTNPDGTVTTADYATPWEVKSVDANNHQRTERRDAYGRLIEVKEFTGTSSSPTVYATTTYEYNELGNLKSVTDAKGNKTSMRYDSLGRKLAMSDPDMGRCGDLTVLSPNSSFPWYSTPCWNYEYDASGNLIRQQDGKGQVIWFQYDALSRLRQKDYGTQKAIGSGDVVYTYDAGSNGIGRLSQVSDLSGSSAFSYDVMGRVIETGQGVGGTMYTTKTQYDSAGRVSAIAYPDNPDVYSVQYEYNGPVLKRVYEGVINHVQYSGHNGLGQPGTAVYANGVTTTYTYSNSGNSTCPQDNYRLCTQRTARGSSPIYQDLRYSYDNVGNVNQIIDNTDANNTQSFIYDELNRLTSAQAAAYGTISYVYNEIGNMMTNSQVGSYDYPLTGIRPHAVTTAGGNTYSYDDNGNMTSGAGRTIVYDYDNRSVSITAGGVTTTFLYDGAGNRVRKTANGVMTVYIGKLYENTLDGCVKYIFAGDQRIAMKDAIGALFYYHTDHLGSSSVVTDAGGNLVERLAYFPYGQTRINTGTEDVHHKFTGQELDTETWLYFYGARYYDPQLGRFISADTIVPNPGNPQDMNRYSYVSNNPLNYVDPTGHSWFSKAWHDVEDTLSEWGEEIKQFLDKNHVNVNAGAGGAVNSGGKVGLGAYNPETGEIYPYMPSSAAEVSTVSMGIEIYSGTVSSEYNQYAEAYTSDAGTLTAKDEITELTRLIYAEAAGEYKIPNAMEGVAWVVRNRVMSQGWPDTYYGVIHQRIQFSSVPPNCGDRCYLWNQAGNPQAFSGKSLSAYYMALTVSAGVYNGTIADPTGGALFYHSGARESLPAKSAAFFGTLTPSIPKPLGPFRFYK